MSAQTSQKAAQHTPGPWFLSHGAITRQLFNADGNPICDESLMGDSSALYGLLTSLRACIRELAILNLNEMGEQKPNTPATRVLEEARAAIAKAEGRS